MLSLYTKNTKLLRERGTEESTALRTFLKVPQALEQYSDVDHVMCKVEGSVVLSSKVRSGRVIDSVLSNVKVSKADLDDCVVINVTASSVKGKGAFEQFYV